MNPTPPNLSDFRPVVGDPGAPRKQWFGFSRSVVIMVVVGLHVVVGGWFALPVVIKAIEEKRVADTGPPVQLLDMEITTLQPEVAAKSRKPRLKAHAETPSQFAQRAGVRVDLPARTLLLVSISAEGKAGAIEIAESSGNPRLDDIAVQYARAQEWMADKAEYSSGSIPFPVEFVTSG